MKSVAPEAAAELMRAGALMVDVREDGEFAQARIPGSHSLALSRLEMGELPLAEGQAVVFLCASGNRTNVHAARLARKAGDAEAYVMAGGLSAWSRAGLPVETGRSGEEPRGGLLSRLFPR
jgi:rhodanese-related sulfurtransferase